MPNESSDDLGDDKAKKISVSMPKSLLETAKARAKALRYKKVSHYIARLIEDDLEERGDHVVVRSEGNKDAAKQSSPKRKEKRARLTDKAWVSLGIYGDIPAGYAEDIQSLKPKRKAKLHRSHYRPGMFGLDVTGESMNAAKGRLGPILPSETVLVMPFTTASDAAGKIVAANIDGRTTLKRMVCPEDAPCHLQPESTLPEFAGKMHPLDEITVLGVVVGKL